MSARKITGVFCERIKAPKSRFAKGSFRWKKSGRAWLLLACPKVDWNRKTERCGGMRAYAILTPKRKGRCTVGSHMVRK